MSRIFLIIFVFASFLSCKKDEDPGFSSPAGSWTYTTPDGTIGVTFDVVKASSGFDIQNQIIKVNSVEAKAEKIVSNFTLTSFTRIRIIANDAKVTYPYDIIFNSGTVNGDFTSMTVLDASYTTFSPQTPHTLNSISITRK